MEAAGFLGMTVEMLSQRYGHHHPAHLERAKNAFGQHRRPLAERHGNNGVVLAVYHQHRCRNLANAQVRAELVLHEEPHRHEPVTLRADISGRGEGGLEAAGRSRATSRWHGPLKRERFFRRRGHPGFDFLVRSAGYLPFAERDLWNVQPGRLITPA
jgi:hypothetical protein